ncbi:MAG: NADH-quinone oxidoreductase subunit J [Candidatus Marinimicrobia bacterium]|nr:NADH-quinone oxidoreductase subunit J [Candidatus Neomarinimicrobiota bacterium]
MSELLFWFISAFTIISALIVVLNNQLLYSAIALLFTLFGVAGLYIYLWADFIAGVQLLVYIGGINVLIIFGIMLTNRISSVRLSQTNIQQGVGGVFALWVFIFIGLIISKTEWYQMTSAEPSSTVREIGTLLMTKYLLPFEAASVLLLGALIGAAILSREAN